MSLKIEAIKNISSSWLGLGVTIVVGFFLSPFILHKLGDAAFGLWVLIFSVTGYYGLFDLGIRSSIIRYVSKFTATGRREDLGRVINTSLFSYACVAMLLLLLTAAGYAHVDSWFRLSPAFVSTARNLFLIAGSGIALGFPLSVFGGVLEGLQKFYLLNLIQVISTLVRALLIVVALEHGGGLLTITVITVALPLISGVVYAVMVVRMLPLQFGKRFIDWATFRQVANYGSVTFMIIVAARLRFKTDALVIGALLSSTAITFFTIGSRLVDYAEDIVQSLAQIFTPMSSHFDATGEIDQLRKIFVAGNRACAMIIFPIAAALIVLGKSVIEVWVGPQYLSSYTVMLILLIPTTLYCAQASSNKILFGMSRHRPLAVVLVIEGIANLLLSIALVRPFGIVGDALGTAIPLLCTSLFFLPIHLCRLLKIRLLTFLSRAYLPPLGLCCPLVLVLLLSRHLFYAHTYGRLLVQLVAGGTVYLLGLLWLFLTREPMGVELLARFGRFLQETLGEGEG
jgi:O-antigen/teichoic acid export membrane protein